jgi:hypothetical protein
MTEQTLTPLQAIRQHCLWCCNGSWNEVNLCVSTGCPLWTLRHGHRPDPDELAAVADVDTHPAERPSTQDEVTAGSRLKAIRRRCLDCSGASSNEVRDCRIQSCSLHPFRLGTGNRSRNLTDEQRAAVAARLAAGRERRAQSDAGIALAAENPLCAPDFGPEDDQAATQQTPTPQPTKRRPPMSDQTATPLKPSRQRKYSDEALEIIASQYTSRSDFRFAHPSAYALACQRGILQTICAHMPARRPHQSVDLSQIPGLKEAS